jgi:O-antigen/teichoic acid export membrane protein
VGAAILQGLQEIRGMNIAFILSQLGYLGLLVLTCLVGWGIWGLILATATMYVIQIAVVVPIIVRHFPRGSGSLSARSWGTVLRMGWQVQMVWIADFAVFQVPKVAAGVLVSASAAGQLDLALRIPIAAAGVAIPILPPLIPAASHFMALGERHALVALCERAMRYLAVIVFPTFAVVLAFGPAALTIWVGSVGSGLDRPVRLLAIALLANTLTGVATSVALGADRVSLALLYKLVLVLATSALVVPLSRWGLTGIATAMAFGFVLSLGYMTVTVGMLLGSQGRSKLMRVAGRAGAAALTATGLGTACGLLLNPLPPAVAGGSAVTLAVAVYSALVLKTRLITKSDFQMIARSMPFPYRGGSSRAST